MLFEHVSSRSHKNENNEEKKKLTTTQPTIDRRIRGIHTHILYVNTCRFGVMMREEVRDVRKETEQQKKLLISEN